jgi:hypothetical protein
MGERCKVRNNMRKRQADKDSQKSKDKDAVTEARKRLKANEYSKYRGLAEFKRIEDEMTVSNKAKPSRDLVRETLRTRTPPWFNYATYPVCPHYAPVCPQSPRNMPSISSAGNH